MNIYETLKNIHNQYRELESQIENTSDEIWINEAIKQGFIVKDRTLTKVSKKLMTFGPMIEIWTHVKKSYGNYVSEDIIGAAKYTTYNNKWEIQNFNK